MSLGYPQWLMERVFGGTHVADTPGSVAAPEHWPIGESPPASEEVCDLLLTACGDKERDEGPVFVFLVGGAGNGKSFLAKKVASQLSGSRVGKASKFSSRSYDYILDSGAYLRIVNDATIPPRQPVESSKHLTNDVEFCIQKGAHLLACVNRGVLIAESQRDPDDIPSRIVNSLLDEHADSARQETKGRRSQLYLRGDEVLEDGSVVQIHVVFMDQCSLFEPFPPAQLITNDGKCNEVEIAANRLVPLKSDGSRLESLPGKTVISALLDNIKESLQSDINSGVELELDPLRSNLLSLSESETLSGLCDLIRGAEIIAGEKFSYRDIWGLATTALLGPVSQGDLRTHQCTVWHKIEELQKPDKSALDRLRAMLILSECRMHMALFPRRVSLSVVEPRNLTTRPSARALEAMALADPIRGLSDECLRLVRDKLALLDEHIGPGESLAEENPSFKKVWTSFDIRLEKALLDWLYDNNNPPKFKQRNELLAWYGQYLARLYALSIGQPAFVNTVKAYSEIWNLAALGKRVPDRLESGLKDLIFASYSEANDETFLPIFSPRVNPVSDADIGGKVVLEIRKQEYFLTHKINSAGAIAVQLKAHRHQAEVARFILDFAMLREAFAHRERAGFTEQLLDIEPRIERARANMLGAEMRRAREGGDGNPPPVRAVNNGVIL